MSLFNEAIQTLSDLAIQESGITIPETAAPAILDEFKSNLDSIPSLSEEDMEFPAELVPVRESKELKTFLIEMEDLSRYMITNDIHNIMEAIENICEANNAPQIAHNITLVIDEQSILTELAELGFNVGDPNPQVGLGKGMLGPHLDINKFRKFANSKELLDTVTNRYGLKVAKKKYPVGMVNEDTKLEPKPGNQVLTEKPKKENISKQQPKQPVTESIELNSREKHLQYLKDVAAGKYDDEILKEDSNMSYLNFKGYVQEDGEPEVNDNFYEEPDTGDYDDEVENDINSALYADEDDNDYVQEDEDINPAFYSEAGDPSQRYKNAIDIPDYGCDHSVGDGDDPKTSQINIPALLAAKTAGGNPHPETLKNGISNKKNIQKFDEFKIKI